MCPRSSFALYPETGRQAGLTGSEDQAAPHLGKSYNKHTYSISLSPFATLASQETSKHTEVLISLITMARP